MPPISNKIFSSVLFSVQSGAFPKKEHTVQSQSDFLKATKSFAVSGLTEMFSILVTWGIWLL